MVLKSSLLSHAYSFPPAVGAYANALQEEGEKALLLGDQNGLDLLEQAAQLNPSSPDLFYRQGLALFEFGSQQNCVATLKKGASKFKQALALNPNLCEAWHAWASTLMLISALTGRVEELINAKDKIENAAQLASQELAAEIEWDAAHLYQKLAERSGELDDLSKALFYFEKSSSHSIEMPYEFWNDFGRAYATLSDRMQDIRPILKATLCYKQAITFSLENFEGWMGLGRSLKKLYYLTQENEYYNQACDCFVAACQLKPEVTEVWLERIEFMIESAHLKKEIPKLQAAVEKCEQAQPFFAPPSKGLHLEDFKICLDPDQWNQNRSETPPPSKAYLHLLGYWAEALTFLGAWTGRIELLREGEQKIDQALEALEVEGSADEKEDIFLIHQHGKCLHALAHYYQDVDLYYQAIERFQWSLTIDRTHLSGWVWMGATYAQVYEYTEDFSALEKAVYFYSKAHQIKNDPYLYYEMAALLTQWAETGRSATHVDQALHYLEYLLHNYKSTAFEHPEWFYYYGVALDLQGELKDDPTLHHKALDAMLNVLMLNPAYPQLHHRIGMIYCHLGDALEDTDYLSRSLHHYKLASQSQPENEMLLFDWGLTWMHLAQLSTQRAMEENCFREAEQKLIQCARLGNQTVYYQLACLYSLMGSYDQSVAYLHKSFASHNLPPLEEMMEDEWLEGVRLSPSFQEFLALLQKK